MKSHLPSVNVKEKVVSDKGPSPAALLVDTLGHDVCKYRAQCLIRRRQCKMGGRDGGGARGRVRPPESGSPQSIRSGKMVKYSQKTPYRSFRRVFIVLSVYRPPGLPSHDT